MGPLPAHRGGMQDNPLRDRMFHVIVLGGIGLVSLGGCGQVTSEQPSPMDASQDAGGDAPPGEDAFPSEGPAFIVVAGGPDAFPSEGPAFIVDAGEVDAFPSETGYMIVDASPGSQDASHLDVDAGRVDAFPIEGPPPPPDAARGVDASPPPLDAAKAPDAGCFPDETAFVSDSGCPR